MWLWCSISAELIVVDDFATQAVGNLDPRVTFSGGSSVMCWQSRTASCESAPFFLHVNRQPIHDPSFLVNLLIGCQPDAKRSSSTRIIWPR